MLNEISDREYLQVSCDVNSLLSPLGSPVMEALEIFGLSYQWKFKFIEDKGHFHYHLSRK